MAKSFFHDVSPGTSDPIFELARLFQSETNPDKVDLSVGVYRDSSLNTPIFHAVKEAEERLFQKEITKSYLPIEGERSFIHEIGKLVFGGNVWEKESHRIFGMQALGGTGAIRLGADFLKLHVTDDVFISDPAWPNYKNIFTQAGFHVQHYPYFETLQNGINFDASAACIQRLPINSAIVFQACCHNPTGMNFSLDQWKILKDICREKNILPFFDFAYQGLGRSIQEDAKIVRLFAQDGMEMVVAYSCSKNFGLYSERVGALFLCADSSKSCQNLGSHLKKIARATYSNPARHGSSIVKEILSDVALKAQWADELNSMRERIALMRKRFVHGLQQHSKRNVEHLLQAEGMFCFTGLSEAEVLLLRKKFAIFMTLDGRLNIAGLADKNFDYVIQAIASL